MSIACLVDLLTVPHFLRGSEAHFSFALGHISLAKVFLKSLDFPETLSKRGIERKIQIDAVSYNTHFRLPSVECKTQFRPEKLWSE